MATSLFSTVPGNVIPGRGKKERKKGRKEDLMHRRRTSRETENGWRERWDGRADRHRQQQNERNGGSATDLCPGIHQSLALGASSRWLQTPSAMFPPQLTRKVSRTPACYTHPEKIARKPQWTTKSVIVTCTQLSTWNTYPTWNLRFKTAAACHIL